jgi:hypothetical protein
VEVLRSQGTLEELKLGVFGTERHLAEIRGEMVTSEQMDAVSRQMTSAQEVLGRGQAETNGKLDDISRSEQQKLEVRLALLKFEAELTEQQINSGNPTLNKHSSSAETETVDEKWDRLRDDAGAEGKSIPADYTLVTAFEGIFLDGNDVCNKEVLLRLMDIGNTGVVTKGEFKKFCSRWKKTGLDFAAYLEQETEKVRKAEERRKELQRMGPGALVDAANKGDAKMVRELLAAGADVNHTKEGDDGRTALYRAAMNGHLEAAQALIDAGADVDKGKTTDGDTPLITAAFQGHLEVVKALVGAKANVNKAGYNGFTPLRVAIGNNHTSVVEYLKSVGAHE